MRLHRLVQPAAAFLGPAALGFALTLALVLGLGGRLAWPRAGGAIAEDDRIRLVTGANAPGLTHYGYGDLVHSVTDGDVDLTLGELQHMGATVVRVFPAYDQISAAEAAARLDRFLTRAQRYHISAIVSLINYYGSHQNPPGTDAYYTEQWHGIPYLNHDFIAGGYRGAYRDFVRTVVLANRDHANIYAWEPGNELQDRDSQAFVRFMQDMTAYVKRLDPGHPIASGMIQAEQADLTPDEMYGNLPAVDIVAIHPGNGYRGSSIDVDWAVAHGKQAIVEETGFAGTDDRTARIRDEMAFWAGKGVSAFLLDGFVAKGLPDTGQGDRQLGFDAIWHSDYGSLANLLRSVSRPAE